MAETIQYKCPCCGGRLEFDSGLQKMKCPYCDTTFDVETLEGYDDALKQDAKDDMHWDAAQQPWDDVQMGVYTCKSCGGELVCDGFNTSGFSGKEAIARYLDTVKAEAAEAN